MKIKTTIKIEEAKDIIKTHVLKELPISMDSRNVYVEDSYGEFVVVIEDRTGSGGERWRITKQ